jgi:hypothetical protein
LSSRSSEQPTAESGADGMRWDRKLPKADTTDPVPPSAFR